MNIKAKDIVDLITDTKLQIEIIEQESGASLGYDYNITFKPLPYLDKEVKNINVQYTNGKKERTFEDVNDYISYCHYDIFDNIEFEEVENILETIENIIYLICTDIKVKE